MATLDLTPYHVELILNKDSEELHTINYPDEIFESGSEHSSYIRLGRDRYNIVKILGSGTFGVTYLVEDAESQIFACKVIKRVHPDDELVEFFKECLINIILCEASKEEPDGPYVPRLYRIAYSEERRKAFLLSEVMHNTLDNVISAFGPAENDKVVPDALDQIAKMLNFFGRKLRLNHRDLKGDNVMYVKNADGKRLFRLIDFGFTCLTWNGIQIAGTGYFDEYATCYKKDRDLSQLIYSTLRFSGKYLSPKLYKHLAKIIIANVGDHKCRMAKSCPRNGVYEWRNTYDFLDRDNVSVPKAEPLRFLEELGRFGKRTRKMPTLARKICPPGKVINPKTGRCVNEAGAVGKKVKAPLDAPAPCPEGKIRNPRTRRCVKVKGALGKRLAADDSH
jgi:hypothetical protein